MSITIHSLLISHRHGEDYYVLASHADLQDKLFSFVARSWDADGPTGPMPEDKCEAVHVYFDHQAEHGDESYHTDEHAIHGAMWETGVVAAAIAKDREVAI